MCIPDTVNDVDFFECCDLPPDEAMERLHEYCKTALDHACEIDAMKSSGYCENRDERHNYECAQRMLKARFGHNMPDIRIELAQYRSDYIAPIKAERLRKKPKTESTLNIKLVM